MPSNRPTCTALSCAGEAAARGPAARGVRCVAGVPALLPAAAAGWRQQQCHHGQGGGRPGPPLNRGHSVQVGRLRCGRHRGLRGPLVSGARGRQPRRSTLASLRQSYTLQLRPPHCHHPAATPLSTSWCRGGTPGRPRGWWCTPGTCRRRSWWRRWRSSPRDCRQPPPTSGLVRRERCAALGGCMVF